MPETGIRTFKGIAVKTADYDAAAGKLLDIRRKAADRG
jgi:hypothetical protein